MAWFKKLSWIILSAACVSCQQITSTLREGNRTCPEEEVIFTCTVRGSSTLPVLVLGWSSDEYIGLGGSLQLSTANMIGHLEISTNMDGSITATATVTNNTNVNGERILESTLRITAIEPSVVTCSGISGDPASIKFTLSAVPGVPQRIRAVEVSRRLDNICIILVEWDPPANSDAADIGQYIVYIPSRNTRDVSSSTISTLAVPNCGDDIRIQVAAVNRFGCVGMNSSEIQLTLLDIPIAPTLGGSATTEGGSTSSSGQLGAGAIVGIAIGSSFCSICIICCLYWICCFCIVYFSECCFDCGFDSYCDCCFDLCDKFLSKRKNRKKKSDSSAKGCEPVLRQPESGLAAVELPTYICEDTIQEPRVTRVTSLSRRVERDDGSDSDEDVLKVHPDQEWNNEACPVRMFSDGGYR